MTGSYIRKSLLGLIFYPLIALGDLIREFQRQYVANQEEKRSAMRRAREDFHLAQAKAKRTCFQCQLCGKEKTVGKVRCLQTGWTSSSGVRMGCAFVDPAIGCQCPHFQ